MKPLRLMLAGAFFSLAGCSVLEIGSYELRSALKEKSTFEKQEAEIYAHMKRYGINREDVAALGRLLAMEPPYLFPRVNLLAEKVLNPGENYRVEMDDLVLTMKVPDLPASSSWIWPFTNLRNPDEATLIDLRDYDGRGVQLAALGWYTCNSLFPPGIFGRCEVMGAEIIYGTLQPDQIEKYSTPEKLQQLVRRVQQLNLPTPDLVEASRRGETIINFAGTRIALEPEIVVINGRKWIVSAKNVEGINYRRVYTTTLYGDRMLSVSFGMPKYDYNNNPDRSRYPSDLKKAFAQMEEMVASLRIARISDDGSPDPFVIERVEPAPLPVREPLPSAPPK